MTRSCPAFSRLPHGEFWVDRLQPRFWVFHTIGASALAAAWLRDRVESRRDTDWMWLPSAHLRYIAPDALSRRVGTRFDGKRLVSSETPPATSRSALRLAR